MKRVVALFLIASVALFAAVAPQSNLKVKSSTPMESRQELNVTVETFQQNNLNVRPLHVDMAKAPAITVDSTEVNLIYLEDFESGAPGWTQYDGTFDSRAVWTLGDYYSTGDSLWWCGDAAIGGYYDNWMVALETPSVVLTAGDSTLRFQLNMSAEDPGTSGDYDGWDGANVQISNDDGETWTVLPVTGVPYNCTSMYSFGFIWGMGVGVPGWGGAVSGNVEADLGAYIGDTVKVRIVFASDGSQCAVDDAGLFGVEVDSINVAGDAIYNGSVSDSLVSVWVPGEPSGTFWSVDTRTDSLPSGTHALRNFIPGDTTYALNLEDYFVSPPIALPDEPATLIYCNFEFYPDFYDDDEYPDVEYWRLEVSPDGGTTWYAISNPYGKPDLSNYVYSTGVANWYNFQRAYSESCDLTEYAGQTLTFRFYFRSDDDTPQGGGLMIDDFVVYSQPDLPAPTGIAAVMNEDNVDVSWDNMDGTYQLPKTFLPFVPDNETGLSYAPGYGFRSYFGSDSALGCSWGMEYSTDGKEITFTSIDYAFPAGYNPYNDSVQVVIWGVDTAYHMLYASDMFVPDTFSTVQQMDISDANIVWTGNFEVEVFWQTSAKYPITFVEDGASFIGITTTGGYYNVSYAVPFGVTGYGEVSYSGLEYNVYRRVAGEATSELLNSSPLSTNSFADETVEPLTEYEYTVVCVSAGFEGQPGDGANIFVLPVDHEESKYDDGSAEEIFEVGLDTIVVVKLTPTSYPAKLMALRFNALYAGDLYKVKIFADDAGMPGDSWLLVEPPVTAIEGWNTFQVPDVMTTTPGRDGVVLRDGESVWVGVKGGDNGAYRAWLGADTDSYSGMATMQVPGGGWTSVAGYLRGNPMIRGYFDTDIDTTAIEDVVPTEYTLAQNYPNPFNPVTTIHFELKNAGATKIDIFDVTGRHVRTLMNGHVEAGAYDLRFDASALSSGVYFYRLTSGSFTDIKKMSLVK